MRGLLTSGVATLGLLAAATAANAETVTVGGISTSSVGNVVVVSSTAQIKVAAANGAVSFPSGTAVRIKTNGASPGNVPVQIVTVTCVNSPGNCKNLYKVFVSNAGVSGQATSLNAVNFSNPSAVSGLSYSASSGEAAPSATVPLFTVTSTNNSFSFTFQIGATATVHAIASPNASQNTAWNYNVRVSQ